MRVEEYRSFKDRVFPLLMAPGDVIARGGGQVAAARLTDDLVIVYALDEGPEKIRYLTFIELREWNVSLEQLHADAIANLEKLSADKPLRKLADEDGRNPMFIWAVGDGFDSGRMLLVDWLAYVARQVEGRLVLAVPDRHWVVAVGDRDPRVLQAIKRKVEERFTESEDSISSRLYTWDGREIRPYLQVITGGRTGQD
jgi:uncharacterized protein YtpQ (UPF0354 family)